MPYIKQERRDMINPAISDFFKALDEVGVLHPGDFNYILTRLCSDFVGRLYTYTDLNEVVGVLECVKQEFYRRLVAAYEDEKLKENGDVFHVGVRGKS